MVPPPTLAARRACLPFAGMIRAPRATPAPAAQNGCFPCARRDLRRLGGDRHEHERSQYRRVQMPDQTLPMARLTNAVVQVGDARGFILKGQYGKRFVVTAAHYLPRSRYPFPSLANTGTDLALRNFIGPLGSKRSRRTIWAEIYFLSLLALRFARKQHGEQGAPALLPIGQRQFCCD